RMATGGEAENFASAKTISAMLRTLNELPKPTIARINGAAYAAGIGLVAACDIAVAVEDAMFSISEVRIGLVPSTISPYVLAARGPSAARRYFLTGEPFPPPTHADWASCTNSFRRPASTKRSRE